jgi:hypothetical protein
MEEARYRVCRSIAGISAHFGHLVVCRDTQVPDIFLLFILSMATDKNEVIAFFVYQPQRQTIVVREHASLVVVQHLHSRD